MINFTRFMAVTLLAALVQPGMAQTPQEITCIQIQGFNPCKWCDKVEVLATDLVKKYPGKVVVQKVRGDKNNWQKQREEVYTYLSASKEIRKHETSPMVWFQNVTVPAGEKATCPKPSAKNKIDKTAYEWIGGHDDLKKYIDEKKFEARMKAQKGVITKEGKTDDKKTKNKDGKTGDKKGKDSKTNSDKGDGSMVTPSLFSAIIIALFAFY